jgi:hypothetical protein
MTYCYSHREDDDEHDQVEGRGESPRSSPHLITLSLGTWKMNKYVYMYNNKDILYN